MACVGYAINSMTWISLKMWRYKPPKAAILVTKLMTNHQLFRVQYCESPIPTVLVITKLMINHQTWVVPYFETKPHVAAPKKRLWPSFSMGYQ